MTGAFARLVLRQRQIERRPLALARLLAALVAASAVALLGLSGWFITAAAFAGAAGPVAARAFNYMLPSAAIRLLAIVRTGARYGERLAGHRAALNAAARIRPAIFRAVAALPPVRALEVRQGEATARLVQDVAAIETGLVRISAPWAAAASVASGAGLGLVAGWAVAAWIAAIALLVVGAAVALAGRLGEPARQELRITGDMKDLLASYAAAAAELQCYDMIDRAAGEIGAIGARGLRISSWSDRGLPPRWTS